MSAATLTRPSRRYPPIAQIEKFWSVEHGYCLRCREPARCERAHLVARAEDGLDDIQNMVPLCYPCHAEQKVEYTGEQTGQALLWLRNPNYLSYLIELSRRAVEQHPDEFAAAMESGTLDDFVRLPVNCDDVVAELLAARALARIATLLIGGGDDGSSS